MVLYTSLCWFGLLLVGTRKGSPSFCENAVQVCAGRHRGLARFGRICYAMYDAVLFKHPSKPEKPLDTPQSASKILVTSPSPTLTTDPPHRSPLTSPSPLHRPSLQLHALLVSESLHDTRPPHP